MGSGSTKNEPDEEEELKRFLDHVKNSRWKDQRNIIENPKNPDIIILPQRMAFCRICRQDIQTINDPFYGRHSCSAAISHDLPQEPLSSYKFVENGIWNCRVCWQVIDFSNDTELLKEIHSHKAKSDHHENWFLWNDEEMSTLMSLATSDIFKGLVVADVYCKLCKSDVPDNHMNSFSHLLTLGRLIERIFKVKVVDIKKGEWLRKIFYQRKWWYQIGLSKWETMQGCVQDLAVEKDFPNKKVICEAAVQVDIAVESADKAAGTDIIIDAIDLHQESAVAKKDTQEAEHFSKTSQSALENVKIKVTVDRSITSNNKHEEIYSDGEFISDDENYSWNHSDEGIDETPSSTPPFESPEPDLKEVQYERSIMEIGMQSKEKQLKFVLGILKSMADASGHKINMDQVKDIDTTLQFLRERMTSVAVNDEEGENAFIGCQLEFILAVLKNMLSSETDRDAFLKDIKEGTWKLSHAPHPSTLANEIQSQQKTEMWEKIKLATSVQAIDEEIVEIVSVYHAYCHGCQWHKYTAFDSCDVASCFPIHMNTDKHVACMETFPRDETVDLFEVFDPEGGLWRCNACVINLTCAYLSSGDLIEELVTHIKSEEHVFSRRLMTDPKISTLVTLSTNKIMRELHQDDSKCLLCQEPVLHENGRHIKTEQHLMKIESYILDVFDHSVEELTTDEEIQRNFWESLVSVHRNDARLQEKKLKKITKITAGPETNPSLQGLTKRQIEMYTTFNTPEPEACTGNVKKNAPSPVVTKPAVTPAVKGNVPASNATKPVASSSAVVTKLVLHNPHPMRLLMPKNLSYAESFKPLHIIFVNAFHAYCRVCDVHIYSQKNHQDRYSYFADHFNKRDHCAKQKTHDREKHMLSSMSFEHGDGYCLFCKKWIPMETPKSVKSIKIAVENHLKHFTHTNGLASA